MSEDKKNLEVQAPNSQEMSLETESQAYSESNPQPPENFNQDATVVDSSESFPPDSSTEQESSPVFDNPEQIIATLAEKLESQPDNLELVAQLQNILVNLTQKQEILNRELNNLKKQLEVETQQAEATKKRYIGIAAEFDNFRKRTLREKQDLEKQVKCKTLSELLTVVDNFERARTQIKPGNDGELAIHKSYQGVYKTLVDSLKRLGVSAMRPEGEPFDPTYHEAMLREATDKYPEGTVIEQLVRGYLLEDQVLRHAMVKVAAEPEPSQTEETTSDSSTEAEPAET